MFVHTTTISAPVSELERGITYVEDEVQPRLRDFDGFVGLSMLADRTIGRCVTASAWETEQAMHAHAKAEDALHGEYFAIVGAENPVAEEWEMALLHRDHPSVASAYARVTWLEAEPKAINGLVSSLRLSLPELEVLPGFCNASLLVNRATGAAAETVTYDSYNALSRNRGPGSTIHAQIAGEADAEVMEVEEFELAIAHLRVPELV